MIRIELDAVRKWRNKQEYRTIQRARAKGHEVTGDGMLIERLCKTLISEGGEAPDEQCEVWRGGTLCFSALNLSEWADGKALTSGEQPPQLRRAAK